MQDPLQKISLDRRFPAPGGRPQPIAFHDGTLWVGCWDTSRVYGLDPATGDVREEFEAPGKPFGLTSFGGALRAVISLGDDDDRYFFTCVPGRGFDAASETPCPDLTGSHLAAEGDTLYLAQLHNARILAMDATGTIAREIPLPTSCGGIGFGAGAAYMISADEEFEEMTLAKFPLRDVRPELTFLARLPPESRSLAYDGAALWTCLRETNEIASFRLG